MCIAAERNWGGYDPPPPLQLSRIVDRDGPHGRYRVGIDADKGRRYYSVDGGQTWHRTVARARRADRRGRPSK